MENSNVNQLVTDTKKKIAEIEQQRTEKEMKDYVRRNVLNNKDAPYYIRYRWLYYLLLIVGWGANLLSGFTESTKVYTFWYDIVENMVYGDYIAKGLTLCFVVALELLNRDFVKKYSEDYQQLGGHNNSMNWSLFGSICCSALSLFLSFSGSFDAVDLVKKKPTPLVAELLTMKDINARYDPLIDAKQVEIKEYFDIRKYKKKLSDKSAKYWKQLKEEKQAFMTAKVAAINTMKVDNDAEIGRVEKKNQKAIDKYNAQRNNQGSNLGFITLFAILVMIASVYYDVYYNKKMDESLAKHKAKFDNKSSNPPPSAPIDPKVAALEKDLQELKNIIKNNKPAPYSGQYFSNNMGVPPAPYTHPSHTTQQRPIGFYNRTSTDTAPTTPLNTKESVPHCATPPPVETVYVELDKKKLTRDISTYYTRCFLKSEVPGSSSTTEEACNNNRQKVEGWIKLLAKLNVRAIVNFDTFEKVKYDQIETEILA